MSGGLTLFDPALEAERRALEQRIAIDAAYCDIESYAVQLNHDWWDLSSDTDDMTVESARYLELCGLLERSDGKPHLVRFKFEAPRR